MSTNIINFIISFCLTRLPYRHIIILRIFLKYIFQKLLIVCKESISLHIGEAAKLKLFIGYNEFLVYIIVHLTTIRSDVIIKYLTLGLNNK